MRFFLLHKLFTFPSIDILEGCYINVSTQGNRVLNLIFKETEEGPWSCRIGKRILRTIVKSYIATAEPIGSKAIAEKAGLSCSSATIRNEMAELEKLGLLEQPHTSSGRIPTPAGYRFYVNELMDQHKLTMQETQTINDQLHLKMQELDRVIDQAGRMVSQLTNYPAFAMADRRGKGHHHPV